MREAFAICREHDGKQVKGAGTDIANDQTALFAAIGPLRGMFRIAHSGENILRFRQKYFARVGQFYGALCSPQKREAQLVLKLSDLLTQRWLHNREPGCRPAEVQ